MPSLDEALQLIESGDLTKAQTLLALYLQHDLRNPLAWFLLAQCVTDPTQRRQCLERTLALDPNHELARQLLAILKPATPQAQTPIVEVPSVLVTPAPEPDTPPTTASETPPSFQPTAFALTPEPQSAPAFSPQPYQGSTNDSADSTLPTTTTLPPWFRTPTPQP